MFSCDLADPGEFGLELGEAHRAEVERPAPLGEEGDLPQQSHPVLPALVRLGGELDLLGDLALAGLPQAQVFAFRGSHGLHTALAAALASLP